MKKYIQYLSLIFFICAIFNTGEASFNQEMLIGARPMAMGGAFVAVADDANAVSINSAGLSQLDAIELLVGYSRLFVGMDYGNISRMFLSGVYPMRKIVNVGVFYNRLDVDNYYESTLLVAIARHFSENFSLGLNLKYLLWDANPTKLFDRGEAKEDLDGKGISIDFTGLIKMKNNLKLGFVLTDINQPDIASDASITPEKISYSLKLGIAYTIKKWLICSDVVFRNFSFSQDDPKNREILKRIGAEYAFFNYRLLARAGVSFYNIFDGFNLSAGAGYKINKPFHIQINYAFIMPFLTIKNTYGTHYLSVGYKF